MLDERLDEPSGLMVALMLDAMSFAINANIDSNRSDACDRLREKLSKALHS